MRVKKSVILAFLVAVGILLQLLESFVGIFMIVPGYKIGLANIAGLCIVASYHFVKLNAGNVIFCFVLAFVKRWYFGLYCDDLSVSK